MFLLFSASSVAPGVYGLGEWEVRTGETTVRSIAHGRCERGGMLSSRSAGRVLPWMVTSRCAVCGGRSEKMLSRRALCRW